MKATKKILSLFLALVMVLSLLPATVFATEPGYVYISVSHEGQFIQDTNGSPIAHVPVSLDTLAAISLDDYGLSEYWYDEDGDGSNEITALQLVIYAHENIYGGSWSDVNFTGTPGSSYFQGGVFGFDENLNYYLNGKYPLAGEGWGATTENIVLEAGDCLDIASFGCWGFYTDPAFGFHLFADADSDITYTYTAEAGTACTVNLMKGTKDENYNSTFVKEPNYTLCYGTAFGTADGTVTTGDDGSASITFPEAGTYYLWCDGGHGTDGIGAHDYCTYYGSEGVPCIVSSPAYAVVTVNAKEEEEEPAPDTPARTPQDVSSVLNATMAKLAATVTEPNFGTSAGEWTVLSLARGGYYAKDNAYFTDYYDRIVATVNTTATSVNKNGALHTSKSTENSRLIVALAALGIDATSVGNWNLITPFEDFTWIAKQGINGPIWALIALDSNDYQTTDTTIRQQCIDLILQRQHNDGGWAGSADVTTASDTDYTGMALQALYPYRDQAAVAAACEKGFACLSAMQKDNGGFASEGLETAESAAQVIVACTTWGINPDTDSRFIKNDKSVVDALLSYYQADSATFQHAIGAGTNDMATDQACYAMIAYDRLLDGKTSLYDFSDVTFGSAPSGGGDTGSGDDEEDTDFSINATLAIPNEIENAVGSTFNATISVDNWDNTAKFKLIDFLMTVPNGLSVAEVTAGDRLFGGEASFNLKAESSSDEEGNTITANTLRCVYFDANENTDLTISGTEFPVEVFTITFKIDELLTAETLDFTIDGMSVKLNSDSSEDAGSMIIINTDPITDSEGNVSGGGSGNAGVVEGISISAVTLYTGDDIDLIPSTRKAVAVAVTGVDAFSTLVYNDGTNRIQFQYSDQITKKSGVTTFVALVDAEIPMANFIDETKFTINGTGVDQSNITFGNINGDGAINAQDALAVVDAWLRKSDAPNDNMILRMNVNGDSRINTFDALGIVEAFVNGSTYGVVTKAAILANQ